MIILNLIWNDIIQNIKNRAAAVFRVYQGKVKNVFTMFFKIKPSTRRIFLNNRKYLFIILPPNKVYHDDFEKNVETEQVKEKNHNLFLYYAVNTKRRNLSSRV